MLSRLNNSDSGLNFDYFYVYRSTITASASQAVNRKEQKMDESGNSRATDIRIENFDVAFGDK